MSRTIPNYTLKRALNTHMDALKNLAHYWLAAGAKAFSIWDDQFHILMSWPSEGIEVTHTHADEQLEAKLFLNGQPIGVIRVAGRKDRLQQHQLEAEAMLISHLLSLTIEQENHSSNNAAWGRIKSEVDITASIQLQLLPHKFPRLDDLDLYAYSRPAAQVGGDFYEFTAQKDRPLVFAVGDISGKGLPAAMLMAMTRIVLHGAARFMPVIHPKAIISRVNEDLYDDFTEVGMFATVFTGCYDSNSRLLSYANAGHSPVVYCPVRGKARLLEADGPAIGVLPTNLCENNCFTFHPGDVLVVATDGFNEAYDLSGEMFGYKRFLDLIEELSPHTAEEIATGLLTAIDQFASGHEQHDDQTLIIVKGV